MDAKAEETVLLHKATIGEANSAIQKASDIFDTYKECLCKKGFYFLKKLERNFQYQGRKTISAEKIKNLRNKRSGTLTEKDLLEMINSEN